MKILIIKLGALGDVLRTTCVLKGLRDKYKDCEISWLTEKGASELLTNNELIDTVYIDTKELGKFDLVISLEEEICDLATKVQKGELIGCYVNDGKKVYTQDSEEWFDMSLISRLGKKRADELKRLNKKTYQQHIYEMLDIEPGDYVFNLTREEKEFAARFAERDNLEGFIVGLNAGAGERWETKKISVAKTVELAERLENELSAKVILFGGPEEKERNREIIERVKVSVVDAGCENTLRNFAALIDLCDVLVTSDTLAMHIGIALRNRVVAFFAPTPAAEVDVYGRGEKIIADSDCYCCYKRKIEDGGNCTDKITVKHLFEAVKRLKS